MGSGVILLSSVHSIPLGSSLAGATVALGAGEAIEDGSSWRFEEIDGAVMSLLPAGAPRAHAQTAQNTNNALLIKRVMGLEGLSLTLMR